MSRVVNNDHSQRIRPNACVVALNEMIMLPAVTKVPSIYLEPHTKVDISFDPKRIRRQTLVAFHAEFNCASNGSIGAQQKAVLGKRQSMKSSFCTADRFA